MNVMRLAWRQLRRDLRSGELTLIGAALFLAVAAMSAVGFFVDRVERALQAHGAELLAADLAIESPYPIAEDRRDTAGILGLKSTRTLSMRTVVGYGERLELAELKAVEAGYPLRGEVKLADTLFAEAAAAGGIPTPGTAWAESRLFHAFNIERGAAITVGATALTVARVLAFEPDRGGDLFAIAPRLIVNLADIEATGLIVPGSRLTHRLLLAGEPGPLAAFREAVKDRLAKHEKLLSVRDARPELRVALDHARQFLGLAALSAVLLAGVAMAMAAARFAARHLDTCAILRCLGATQAGIVGVFTVEIVLLGLVTGLTGCLAGYLAQGALATLFSGLTEGVLPPPSPVAVLSGLAIGLAALAGFALAPLLPLKAVPPLRVLRRDLKPAAPPALLAYGLALGIMAALAPWAAGEATLTLYVLAGAALTVLLLAAAALLAVRLLGRLRSRVGVSWRFGLASLARRGASSTTQVVALGSAIMIVLLVTLVRADLLAGWQASIPPGAPNQFLINIPPDAVEPLRRFLTDREVEVGGIFPMVRGRLVGIDGRAVRPGDYADARAQRLADREFNLSWAADLQADNRIVAGRWWQAGERAPQFSVESGIAETLGMRLGDRLAFRIGDRPVTAPITSLREVDWESFNANFFVVAPPGWLDDFPATYLTSFHLDAAGKGMLTDLVRAFPSVTVIDVAALMDHVRGVIDRVTAAVEHVFAFTLAAGLLVLIAAIQTTRDERRRESAMLKTLGAQRVLVRRGLAAEFLLIGLIAGVLAAAGATLTGYVLARQVFHIGYQTNLWIWPAGLLAGTLGVTLAGLAGLRGVLDAPPATALRSPN